MATPHRQSLSPVTHSVCNCVKRALLIWISVFFWHNEVSILNGLGTFVLIGGVMSYNRARQSTGSGLPKSSSTSQLPTTVGSGNQRMASLQAVTETVEHGEPNSGRRIRGASHGDAEDTSPLMKV